MQKSRIVVASVVLLSGCVLNLLPAPAPLCPLPVSDAPGFTATLPCNLTLANSTPPNAAVAWLRKYDDSVGASYVLSVLPASSSQISVGTPGNFKFTGTVQTNSGDLLVQSEIRSGINATSRAVVGLLANADTMLLLVGPITTQNADATLLFSSVDLTNTDGTGINAKAKENSPTLLAPPVDLVAVLNDHNVYRLVQSSASDVLKWAAADSVVVTPNKAFTEVPQAYFVTQIGQWVSQLADFVGRASSHTVMAITNPVIASMQVTLSDGSKWNINATDEFKLTDWSVADNIELVRDNSLGNGLTHLLINLKNGDAAAASFGG